MHNAPFLPFQSTAHGAAAAPSTAGGAAAALTWLAALALSGCAVATPPGSTPPPLTVPTAWAATLAAPHNTATTVANHPYQSSDDLQKNLANWWSRFNDAQLTELVSQALQANTSIGVAQAALQQSRALRDVQVASTLPGLSASGAVQRSQSGSQAGTNTFKAGLDASWEPDIFGRQRSTTSATEADAQAAQASLGNVQVSVAAEVALAYIQLRGLQTQLQIARDNLASQQATLQITQWRHQAGLATVLDVEQSLTASEQTAAQVPALQTSLDTTRHSLAVLTGQTPDALQALAATARPVPQAAPDMALNIPADTLRQRPDVRAAELKVQAALARVSAADAARYPGFALNGSLGLSALTLGSLGSAPVVSALLASVSAPLFDGGATNAQVQAQTAALAQAQASHRAAILAALKDVEDALVALSGDLARQVRLQSAASAAAKAAQLARQRYASGLIDFQTVLQTQRTLLTTQDSLASNQASLSADHVRLYKALGGGWQ